MEKSSPVKPNSQTNLNSTIPVKENEVKLQNAAVQETLCTDSAGNIRQKRHIVQVNPNGTLQQY